MKKFIAILTMLLTFIPMMARDNDEVDVQGIIFGHLKDSYEWHVFSTNSRDYIIDLPVILYSKVSGWHFFMSDKLEENGSYDGFHVSDEGASAGKLVETLPDGTELKPLDLSLTKVALGVIINCLLLCIIIPPII